MCSIHTNLRCFFNCFNKSHFFKATGFIVMETIPWISCLLILLQFTVCTSTTSNDTITINQIFTDGDLLISKEKTFAFGFFNPGSSSYRYLGIWFYNIPGQTVVWVANRNNPINGSSGFLSINQQGNLVLYGEDSDPVWSTNASVETTGNLAQLLDSGNLVLVQRNKDKSILWQSFDHPTDTLLPGMKIGVNRKTGQNWMLKSWRSENDPGIGNFFYRLNPNGSPQIFLYNDTTRYWRSNPWPWRINLEVYYCSFINNQDEICYNCSLRNTSVISRQQLDHLGIMRWLVWQENDDQWKEFQSLPRDRCDDYGRCGGYGKCDSNTVTRYECACLPGYEPKSPRNWNLWDGRDGCVRKRKESSSVCGHGEGFIKVESVKLPDASAAVWVDMSTSHIDCEQQCKRNCACSAYSTIFIAGNGSGCLAWYGELIDTKTYPPDAGYDLYVRVDALELADSARRSSSSIETKRILIVSVASVWFIIILIIYCWLKKKKKKRKMKRNWNTIVLDHPINGSNYYRGTMAAADELEGGSRSHQDLVLFKLSTILVATDNFSPVNKIGQGGFGTVYKGQLSNGKEIAIKRMSKTSMQGIEELKNEVMLIAKLQHRNLVKLLGCCVERNEQMLIYEYLANKSLDTFLFDERKRSLISWETRFNIIVGIARGILYLHQDSRLTVIHRDLKSSNILLDADMKPKISDFGMARLFKSDELQGETNRVVGTYGYMSPEYAVFGKYSVKSDIFSFGIILLEIISGKKTNGFTQKDASLNLIGQVWELWKEERALEIVDSSLTGSCNSDEVLRCIQVGLLCVQEDAMDRPAMLEVVLMLKSDSSLPSPKQPAFIFRASSSNTNSAGGNGGSCSINGVTITAVSTR
ncbi:G-type lectin S-receptor-like serine/threonine-protein kinase At1g11410 [Ricinus communis]|uniref:G-type lectin S-receptor-like serine/threonine-protein kinase At1g11410 n=1 Tax=Ricinus communis TaxID=3988 RepID=UPI00201ACCB8|nr:G-type lectin S-receptor-like serine/threonine-protein kinase At1g11410 [Ricinus communis]